MFLYIPEEKIKINILTRGCFVHDIILMINKLYIRQEIYTFYPIIFASFVTFYLLFKKRKFSGFDYLLIFTKFLLVLKENHKNYLGLGDWALEPAPDDAAPDALAVPAPVVFLFDSSPPTVSPRSDGSTALPSKIVSFLHFLTISIL